MSSDPRSSLPLLSIIVPVLDDREDIGHTHSIYEKSLENRGYALQFVYVVDGDEPKALRALEAARGEGKKLEILHLPRADGEATALSVGFRHAEGELVMTLPDHPQVVGDALGQLLSAIDGADLVIANRISPSRPEDRKFERIVRFFLGSRFKDLRSGVRIMRRAVCDEVVLYGDQHSFLPLIAETHGFEVDELDLPSESSRKRPVSIGGKPSLLLDVLAAFFLIRFVKRPFRFFGGIGLVVLAVGASITAYLIFVRLFLGVALLDRPALVLSTLMIVLGIQILSVGLIGEIITFAYTKEHKDYRVARIID